ncbi:MlaA family lipoprotein [Uliginosibacterium sp. H1]|uniref:MlaA family lipoprotein n=1 Tax=Uliginosibacterium sp. H1 TaxID=3114757 RepID=UPI002E16D8C4|nr:VacJ family lipoprotein [Uliginosibacterium sp. H1]
MAQEGLRDPRDPWEKFNRGVYAFNDAADTYVLKPVAETYVAVTPLPARTWVANFLGNFGDTWIAFNNLLQGKFGDAASDVGRILVNSTVGILGTFDVASEMGLEKHDEDFGQTLAVWGVGGGPFVEVPLFGPRTLRDGAALFVDKYVDPFRIIDRVAVRNTMAGMQIVSDRSFLLGAETVLDNAALDKYAYRRDFYLKRRTYLIYDGNPPRDDEEE